MPENPVDDPGSAGSRPVAIVALTAGGAGLGRRLQAAMPGARLLGRRGRVAPEAVDVLFDDTIAALRGLFAAGTAVVGVCAAGVLIRAVAPLLADKHTDPPVLAVAEDGSAVVPLLGGHGRDGRPGANALARRLATALRADGDPAVAAVTTAGDVAFGIALDDPPAGWRLAEVPGGGAAMAKAVTAHLLAGGGVRLDGPLPWLTAAGLPADPAGPAIRATVSGPETAGGLTYHPAALAVGVGCERGTPADEVAALVRAALAAAGLAPAAVGLVASLDLKMDEPAVQALAADLGVPARFFDAATLEAETPRLATPSDVVFAEVGCHGVAEAAALAAVGPAGHLLLPKHKGPRATVAVAVTGDRAPLRPATVGRARGRLAVVGIGPGQPGWRTPEAEAWLAGATDWVGYDLYLDLLADDPVLAAGARTEHRFPLGAETDRVRHALALAAAGRTVALVSSGDAGIYAMATLAFELIDRAGGTAEGAAWRRVDLAVTPGITAMQAAAARLGAPLGHDFCAISLSDLLTPWPAIERRVRAAAAGDFVVAFYNPVSRRRVTQLAAARTILLADRPADTPVAIARNLGRPDERVAVTTLAALDPAAVDMLSIVLVGASTTRALARGDGGVDLYTPRGYAGQVGETAGDAVRQPGQAGAG